MFGSGQRISYDMSCYINEGSCMQCKCSLPTSLFVLCTPTHQTLYAVVQKRQYLFCNTGHFLLCTIPQVALHDLTLLCVKASSARFSVRTSHLAKCVGLLVISCCLHTAPSGTVGSGKYVGGSFLSLSIFSRIFLVESGPKFCRLVS